MSEGALRGMAGKEPVLELWLSTSSLGAAGFSRAGVPAPHLAESGDAPEGDRGDDENGESD